MPMRYCAKNRGSDIPAGIHAVEQAIALETDVCRNGKADRLRILRSLRKLPAMFFGELHDVAIGKRAGKKMRGGILDVKPRAWIAVIVA